MLDHAAAAWTSRGTYEVKPGAARYEMWERSVALHVGLAVAAQECARVGPASIAVLSAHLAARLRGGLAAIPGVAIRDAPDAFNAEAAAAAGAGRCAIVAFEAATALGVDAQAIKVALGERKISASVAPSTHHFDDAQWSRPPAVRLSPSYYNTEGEVDAVLAAVRAILQELRR